MRRATTAKSPTKRTTTIRAIREEIQEDSISTLQNENQSLQFALGERDVEIERMKTTLEALNGKLVLISDMR